MRPLNAILFQKAKADTSSKADEKAPQLKDQAGGAKPEGLAGLIWQNLWPVFGLMLLNFIVGYTDIYVAGLLSSEVQAAVGFVSQQYFVLIILGNALAIGSVALVSQATGAGQRQKVFDFARQAFILAFGVGAALWVAALFGARAIIALFALPGSISPIALTYLRIYSLALLPNYMIIVSGAVFRAVGKPLIIFKIMMLVTILNIAANFGLVFGLGPLPRLGFPGIAWATVISMFTGFALIVVVLRTKEWRPIWHEKWRISMEVVSKIFQISWPAALLQIGWNAGNVVIYQLIGRLGAESVQTMAAYANGLRLEAITYLPAFAFNMVAAVLVGQKIGAGRIEEAKKVGWEVALIGCLLLSGLAAILFWAAPGLSNMLTSDRAVLEETVRYLRINLVVAPFMVFSMVLGGGMQGAGDTRGVMKVIVLAIWIVRIPLAAGLCFRAGFGALGIWAAMDLSMIVQTILMSRRYFTDDWHKAGH